MPVSPGMTLSASMHAADRMRAISHIQAFDAAAALELLHPDL